MLNQIVIGQNGALTIPVTMWRRLGLNEGSLVMIEETGIGLMIKPVIPDVEIYSQDRKAEFILSNTIGDDDYQSACVAVRAMGLNPNAIPHERPE
ncbi:SpoVT-AbrB domain-containing protein [Gammaproteobacteria bacterium]